MWRRFTIGDKAALMQVGEFRLFCAMSPIVNLVIRRQAVSDVLTRICSSAHSYDYVLLPVDLVGHGRAALRSWHIDRAHFLAVGLVVSPEHRATRMLRRRRDLAVAQHHQRLGDNQSDAAGLAGVGD